MASNILKSLYAAITPGEVAKSVAPLVSQANQAPVTLTGCNTGGAGFGGYAGTAITTTSTTYQNACTNTLAYTGQQASNQMLGIQGGYITTQQAAPNQSLNIYSIGAGQLGQQTYPSYPVPASLDFTVDLVFAAVEKHLDKLIRKIINEEIKRSLSESETA